MFFAMFVQEGEKVSEKQKTREETNFDLIEIEYRSCAFECRPMSAVLRVRAPLTMTEIGSQFRMNAMIMRFMIES